MHDKSARERKDCPLVFLTIRIYNGFMSQSFKLFRLQQTDSQLDRVRARVQQIETALNQDAELRQAQALFQQAEERLEAAQKDLRRAEQEVQNQRLKVEQTEASLYGGKVRNPKELQDLQMEVGAHKRRLANLEDDQLEAMLALESKEESHTSAGEQLEKVKQNLASRHAELHAEAKELEKEKQRLEGERQATSASIPEADIRLYEQIRKQRRGVAVTKVVHQACGACGSTLSSSLLHAAHSPNQLTRCDMCGRILYAG